MVEDAPPKRPATRRPKRAAGPAKPQAASGSGGTKAAVVKPVRKQAVVVIHGIGEQRPLATLREFVETVYRRDPTFAGSPDDNRREAADGLNPVSIVPDEASGSAELRRITTHPPAPFQRIDFFEFYWADIMAGTPLELVFSWVQGLLFRSPFNVPKRIQVWIAWLMLWAVTLLVVYLGLQAFDPRGGFVAELIRTVAGQQGAIAAVLGGAAFLVLIVKILSARTKEKLRIGGEVIGIVLAAVLALVPKEVLSSQQVWAAVSAALVAYALTRIVGPYVGDVVRYVRATPVTVEKRKLVRERGLELLRALHNKKDVDDQPTYDRIVMVGHSLGAIIAYDLLQHYWEEAGPSHKRELPPDADGRRQDWVPSDALVKALEAVDELVVKTWAGTARPGGDQSLDVDDYTKRQTAVAALLGESELNWRITDLITLGSPLVHAEFLAVDSRRDLEHAFEERLFSASPPRPDQGKTSMLYRAEGAAPGKDRGPFPHFAAPFCAVRWTNIFDDHAMPWFGDLVSGPVRRIFGPGIDEHRVAIRRPEWIGPFARIFTHTRYWTWHEAFDAKDPPYHICLLRRALNLGGKAATRDCSSAPGAPKPAK